MLKEIKRERFFSSYHTIIIGFIILSFLFDFIDKVEIFYDIEFIKLNRVLKAFFLAFSILFIIKNFRIVYKKFKGLFIFIFILTIVFLIKNNFSERYLNEYVRYIFPLIVFPLLHVVYFNKKTGLLSNLYKFFKWLIIINSILIGISILLEIKIFKTYYHSRFGFNGIILSQGVLPYIYLTATTLFWVYKDKAMLFTVLFISLLSGVKGVYFAEFLFFGLLVFFDQELTRVFKIKTLIILFFCFIGLIVGLLLTPLFKDVIKSDGLLAAIFSFRINNTIDLLKEINPTNFNVLIGTTKLNQVRLELQVVDVILFFGLIGIAGYILFFYSLKKCLVKSNVSKVFFISVLITSVFSGNLLYVPLSFIIFLIMLFALKEIEKSEKKSISE